MDNYPSFSGRVALVTGASSGMGLATARAFAEAGASAALAARKEDAVRNAAERLVSEGHRALAILCGVGQVAQVAALVEWTVAKFGRLGAAFNNAGVMAHIAPSPIAPGRSSTPPTCGLTFGFSCLGPEAGEKRACAGAGVS